MGLHPFRYRNPGAGGERIRFDTRDMALTAVFAALYATINMAQSFSPFGNPSVYGPIQLRLSDFLIALAALLGWPVVIGVTAGCAVVNVFGPIGIIDVVFGSLANLVAASLIVLLKRHKLLACIAGALPIGIIVGGGYLWIYYPYQPAQLAFLPAWITTLISLMVSSLVAIAIIGYAVLRILSRPNIIEPLRSHGLKTLSEN